VGTEMTPCGLETYEGSRSSEGGVLDPVCWVQVPEPLGSSSQSSRGLPPMKRSLPVTGSVTALYFWMPQPAENGVSGSAVTLLFAFRRQSFVSLPLPPPKTTTSPIELYSAAQW